MGENIYSLFQNKNISVFISEKKNDLFRNIRGKGKNMLLVLRPSKPQSVSINMFLKKKFFLTYPEGKSF